MLSTHRVMYPRHHSLSQQQIGIPVPADAYPTPPSHWLPLQQPQLPMVATPQPAPRFLQKTSSLPIQSTAPAVSPRLYFYQPSGPASQRSSTIDSQTGLDSNLLNLSQDSGLSPSPLEPAHQHLPKHQLPGEIYDHYRRFDHQPDPIRGESRFGRFSDVFRRHRNSSGNSVISRNDAYPAAAADQPPPLPPKKRSSHPYGSVTQRPASMPALDLGGRTWREERESAMMRVEAQRNSIVISSDEETEALNFRRLQQRQQQQPRQVPDTYYNIVKELCHIPEELREPFPAELDFSQITNQSSYDPRDPPPPPPRDPRRRSLLLQHQDPHSRPVSYSFEHLPGGQRQFHSPSEPPELGYPHHQPVAPVPLPRAPVLHKQFSSSEQHLPQSYITSQPIKPPPSRYVLQQESYQRMAEAAVPTPRRPARPTSLSTPSRTPAASPQSSMLPFGKVDNSVTYYDVAPYVTQKPQQEYWKTPPLPFYQCPEPKSYNNDSVSGSPMRPKQRWRNYSAEDSILLLAGKSSPSSGSLTSRDSGCSEQLTTTAAALPAAEAETEKPRPHVAQQQLPLPVVAEKFELAEKEELSHDEDDDEEEDSVVAIVDRRASLTPSSLCSSSSPPRSGADQPGFSSRKRRSLFRDAMSELEDAIKVIQGDVDLLDRAERRDLPTAHQELIVRARIEEALGKSKKEQKQETDGGEEDETSLNTSAEMAFSDMDNFMNWNTSSSFENLEERRPPASRQRTPSRRRSAVADKRADDVVFRICRDNNRTRALSGDPSVAAAGQSYLLLTPEAAKALLSSSLGGRKSGSVSSFNSYSSSCYGEPDILSDDAHFRSVRDARLTPKVLESQPKFGIPLNPIPSCGKDYLHSVPTGKYKSTFNAMKCPDVFEDDLAVRQLRKDDARSTPDLLGIYKDSGVIPNSCWRHKLEERLRQRPTSPIIFFPNNGNNKLKVALSKRIAETIRKQSCRSVGGADDAILTYDDLLRDRELMKAMKEALLRECSKESDDFTMDTEEKSSWSGKTVFELLTGDHLIEEKVKTKETVSGCSSAMHSRCSTADDVIVVARVELEHQADVQTTPTKSQPDPEAKPEVEANISALIFEDGSTASLRAVERGDSGEEEQLMQQVQEQQLEQPEEELKAHNERLELHNKEVLEPEPHKRSISSKTEVDDGCSSGLRSSSLGSKPDQQSGGETQLGTSVLITNLFDHPAILAACYCLACLHQLSSTGLDWFTSVGVLMAMVSVVAMFFF